MATHMCHMRKMFLALVLLVGVCESLQHYTQHHDTSREPLRLLQERRKIDSALRTLHSTPHRRLNQLSFGSSCEWNSNAFGYLNCYPAESGIPVEVLAAVGPKGSFLKPYLQLAAKCGSMDMSALDAKCPAACDTDFLSSCKAPSPFEYFACPGSPVARKRSCRLAASKAACVKLPTCAWDDIYSSCAQDSTKLADDVQYLLSTVPGSYSNDEHDLYGAYNPTTNLTLWRRGFGNCAGSTYLFNRQVCSSVFDVASSLDRANCLKFPQCEWIDDLKGVFKGCVRKKASRASVVFGGDPALTTWANTCYNLDNTNLLTCWGL